PHFNCAISTALSSSLSLHDALPIYHRSDHRRVLLLHPTHHHAHVLGLDDHGHAQCTGDLLDGLGDLPAEVLLDLQAPRVHVDDRSEEHTSELQSRENLVCRLLLEKK